MSVRIVEVKPLAPDHAELFAQWHAVDEAVEAAEFGDRAASWSAAEVAAADRELTTERVVRLAAVDGPETVGASSMWLPLKDNLHITYCELAVHPDHRRRGVGTALLTAMQQRAIDDGRTVMTVEGRRREGRPDVMTAFAQAHGYEPALVNWRSDLDLPGGADDLDAVLAPLDAEVAEAAARETAARETADGAAGAGGPTSASRPSPSRYRLMTWLDGVPDEWVDQRGILAARMSTDPPLGSLAIEPEVWDADRVREQWRIAAAQGRRVVETVALDEETGELAGVTDLSVAAHAPHLAYQWDTLVMVAHRGARLGMRLKAANLRALLAELPAVRRVSTWNAQENAAMLRVNRAMGFCVVGSMTEWQKTL